MIIKKVTIIIPVYNEEKTILQIVTTVSNLYLPNLNKQIIVVNDGSTDGTFSKLKSISPNKITVINKKINNGKGSAIKSALKIANGEIIIVQDADLEYSPAEIKYLIKPILNNQADVVFGSRFYNNTPHRVLFFWHYIGNQLLTFISNILTNINLTDMETGYKAFTKDVADKLDLKEKGFGFEPEFTIKVSRLKFRIYEVGISYFGRDYNDGKKITWKDGFLSLWCLIKYGILFKFTKK